MATLAPASAVLGRASRQERVERIFQSLPALGSRDYLELLRSARRDDPPAAVLARAFRRLFPGDAADATLVRLVDRDDPPGYVIRILIEARRRSSRLGAYTAADLTSNAIGEIVETLSGPKGKIAETAWALYLETCVGKAYRDLVGRDGSRLGSHAATHQIRDGGDGNDVSFEDDEAVHAAAATAWRASVEPSRLERLERFIERVMMEIEDPSIRAIGLDLFSQSPMKVSSKTKDDPNTLTGRFGVHRTTIYEWQNVARWTLYDALENQNEFEIDSSFLEFGR